MIALIVKQTKGFLLRSMYQPLMVRESIDIRKYHFSISEKTKYFLYLVYSIQFCVNRFFTLCKNLALIFVISFLLAGCGFIGGTVNSGESISEYAELLFKHQNAITQRLMMLSEEDVSELDEEKVFLAELQMHDACQLLNEYARREMEGVGMSVFFRRRVKRSFKKCDESVGRMELILTTIDEKAKK